jgi:hypothetical protein
MFEPIPEPSKSKEKDYIGWNTADGLPISSHRLRVMGTSKSPNTFMQCYQVFDAGNIPHREQYVSDKIPPSDELKTHLRPDNFNPGEMEKVKVAWVFTVWRVDYTVKGADGSLVTIPDGRPMIWNVHQKSIKDMLLTYANNPQWSGKDENEKSLMDLSRFVVQVSRTIEGKKYFYDITPEPPSELPPQEIVKGMQEAMIDVRVMLMDKADPKANDGNPFGALGVMPAAAPPVNDQENIKRLREQGEPIPMGQEQTLSSVGDVAADAVAALKSAQAKSTAVQDDIPF